MNTPNAYPFQLPATLFSFSILVSSPIRRDLAYCPVSAMILPLASTEVHFASLIIAGLDLLMSFLYKRSLVHAPRDTQPAANSAPTLTMHQLNRLMFSATQGQLPITGPFADAPGQGFGPVGLDEPLFPDNLSVSLFIATPFAPFDGSPDTSFTVPLFEVPGAPGNLLIALGLLIAQFFVERTGIGTPNGTGNGGDANA